MPLRDGRTAMYTILAEVREPQSTSVAAESENR